MSDTTTNPKPHTLPVLTEKHVAAFAFTLPNFSDERVLLRETEAVVRALIPGGTHELQERVSGDTVRVPPKTVDRLVACLADCVVKATQYGTQEGGFIAFYILPTGPLHRAMPLLEELGVVVRPGFDGRKPLTPEQEAALAEFSRKMQEDVIPELARKENDARWLSGDKP